MNNLFGESLLLVNSYLQQFAVSNNFWSDFELAFGNKFDRTAAESIRQRLANGNFSLPIRVLPDQVLGIAVGAFAAATNTVYLRESLVNSGNLNHISEVIIEEFGHSIDSQVNKEETPGDEGAIFRLLVKGIKLTAQMLTELRSENDWGTILVDGQELLIEMATTPTEGDDTLTGDETPNYIDGLGGNDTIFGLGGNDTLLGGQGDDYLDGGDGIDSLNGGDGNDTIAGIGSNIDGGAGMDYLTLDYSLLSQSTNTANITFDSFGNGSGTDGTTIKNIEVFIFEGSEGNDFVDASANNFFTFLSGRIGNDTLLGGSGNDNLAGGNGIDSLNGGDGNDTIFAGMGSKIDGGAGTDDLFLEYRQSASTANITINSIGIGSGTDGTNFQNIEILDFGGSEGNDFVDASATNYAVSLIGHSGNDTLLGGQGDDYLDGGNRTPSGSDGIDSLNGGDGNDTIFAGIGSNIDGGAGMDYLTLDYSLLSQSTNANITFDSSGNGSGTEGTTIKNIEIFVFEGSKGFAFRDSKGNDFVDASANNFATSLYGNIGNDTLLGGSGNDYLDGGTGSNYLFGGSGNDTLKVLPDYSRQARNNYLFGGSGNDTLFGGLHDDILIGVEANGLNPGVNEIDNLQGQRGVDRFVLGDSNNIYYDDRNTSTIGNTDYALIVDFNPAEDKIQLQGLASNYLLQVVGANTNLYIDKVGSEPDELIGVLENVTGLNLTSNAFQYVKPVRNDFNNDRKADILWRNSVTEQSYIYQMNGLAVAAEGAVRTLSLDWQIAGTGDFNSNSKSDILWRNQTTGETYIYQMDGSTVANEGSVRTVSLNWQIAGTGDFNGDNKSDILWRNQTTGETYLYQMDGSTVVNERSIRTVSLDWKISGTGDFNGDGKFDILWRNSNSGETYIYQMNGFDIASEKLIRTVNQDLVIEGVDDFNYDGNSDILWRNSVTGQVSIYQMNGLEISIGDPSSTADHKQSYWSIAGTGDYNGDSKADILWRHTNGTAYIWNMDGFALLGEGAIRQVDNGWQIAAPSI
jgi:Ca2+-binding RTX toxin-like protein